MTEATTPATPAAAPKVLTAAEDMDPRQLFDSPADAKESNTRLGGCRKNLSIINLSPRSAAD